MLFRNGCCRLGCRWRRARLGRSDLGLGLSLSAVVTLGLIEGFNSILDRLLDVGYRLGQACFHWLLDLGQGFGSRFRQCSFDGRFVDHLCRLMTFAGGNGLGDGCGSGCRNLDLGSRGVALLSGCRLAGAAVIGRFAGRARAGGVVAVLIVLGGAAATIVATALAVTRATLRTLTVNPGLAVSLLGGLLDWQFFVLHGSLLGLTLRATFLAFLTCRCGLLGCNGALLAALAGRGGGGAATTATAGGALVRLAGAGRGSVGIGDDFAGLAFGALGLVSAFGSGFTATVATCATAVVALRAWPTVAVAAALVATAIGCWLAVGLGGRLLLGFLFLAIVLGEHTDQRLDQALDQSRLGFLNGLVGCGNRCWCRGWSSSGGRARVS